MSYCLIVEDDPVLMIVAKQLVENLGFKTQLATNVDSAIAICKESMPLVVLLDRVLPEKDGIEFLKEFKKMIGFERSTVIMCTGETAKEKVLEALENGAKGYVTKPISQESLEKQFIKLGVASSLRKKNA